MQNVAVRKVRDLDAPARKWFVSIFGRDLQDEEEITLTVYPPHSLPLLGERGAAAVRMDRVLDKAADNLRDFSDSDYEAAVDEAMEHVRPWKK